MTRPDQPDELDPPDRPDQQSPRSDLQLPYNPRAEFGDPDWREPESDEEAFARTAWLDSRPRSPQDEAWRQLLLESMAEHDPLDDSTERLRLAQHDPGDPEELAEAEEEYRVAFAAADARDREREEARQQRERTDREHQRHRGDEEVEL